WLQYKILNLYLRFMHAFDQIMDGRNRSGDNMRLHLKTKTGHTNWILDTFLPINNIATRNHMDHLAVGGDSDSTCDFNSPANIILYDIAMAGRDGDKTPAIVRDDMTTCYAYICRDNFFP